MSTMTGKTRWVKADTGTRVTANGATNGAAVTKGTATDMTVHVQVQADGTSAFAGNVSYQVQGSNDGVTYTNVSADKGALNSDTAANQQVAHYAQLQYKQFRVVYTGAGGPLLNVSADFSFYPVADSFDASVQ